MINRRQVIRGAGAAASAAFIGMPAVVKAQAKDTITLMTPFGFIGDFIEMMNAVSGGHFAAQNLNAKLLGGRGGAQTLQQLITGEVDIIRAGGTDLVLGTTHTATSTPVISISTLYQGSTFQFVSLKSKPIEKAEDLKGKTVGVSSLGGTADVLLDMTLIKVGLTRDDVKREVTGNSPGAIQFVKQGRVDCFLGSLPVVVTLQRMKEDILYWSTDRYAPIPGQCFVTTQKTADTKPDLMIRALRALKASAVEMIDNPLQPIFERAAKDFEIPGLKNIDNLVAAEKAVIEQLWLSEGRENLMRNVPKLWEAGVAGLRAANIGQPVDPATLFTNKFLDA